MNLSPLAGKPADPNKLVDIPKLISAYYTEVPNAEIKEERISFGTSGHRGSSFKKSFNEWHILAITQAICDYRTQQKINGPLFMGMDTHALSTPSLISALEVLAANEVETRIALHDEYTPTPVISYTLLTFNKQLHAHWADGIVITPSHNPPSEGGFKYNPPNGGPADTQVTGWIEKKGNEYLENRLKGVKRIPYEQALKAKTTQRYDFMTPYIEDLSSVIDMKAISESKIKLGVDPLGGAGVHYWEPIGQRYQLNLTIVNDAVDPTFRFMTYDWDGQIRMDPSSPYAMQRLIALKDRFKVAFACDTDHDRHGIVTESAGLMQPNHFLCASILYLFQHRPHWSQKALVGKTLVSSQMIDKTANKLQRKIYEVPVGFKWFVEGLLKGSLAFVGEESAGASFLRRDGSVWTTDKDGIIASLLAAEITAKTGLDPAELYQELVKEFGEPAYARIDAPATPEEKEILKKLSQEEIQIKTLAGEPIESILTNAVGNGAPMGGIKVIAKNGWFAARPSGTEDIYKIYAESFKGNGALQQIQEEAQSIVSHLFSRFLAKSEKPC